MMAKPPLLRLFLGNLGDAVKLGLIDNSANLADVFQSDVEAGWATSTDPADQLRHFESVMTALQARLDTVHRPLRNAYGLVRNIVTVMPFGRFANRFEDEIAAPKSSGALRSLLGHSATLPGALSGAKRACLEFSARFGSLSGGATSGRRIRAGTVGIGAGRRTWIAPLPSARTTNNAQFWRDRLGLIHVQAPAAPLVDHTLVRVEFQIETSRERVDRSDWKGTLSRHPHGLWIIRPTMVHEGNQRFVQAHSADDGMRYRARRHGMTRDLNSARHQPGEREMLLVCGTSANIRFSSVTLLEGMAGEMAARDNSDKHFVEQIAAERGWKPA